MLLGSGIPRCLPQETVNINGQGHLKASPNDVWPCLVALSPYPPVFLTWPWGISFALISKILSHLAVLCSGRSLWGMMMSTGPCFRPLTWFSFCHYWGTRTLTAVEAAFLAKVGREPIFPALLTLCHGQCALCSMKPLLKPGTHLGLPPFSPSISALPMWLGRWPLTGHLFHWYVCLILDILTKVHPSNVLSEAKTSQEDRQLSMGLLQSHLPRHECQFKPEKTTHIDCLPVWSPVLI